MLLCKCALQQLFMQSFRLFSKNVWMAKFALFRTKTFAASEFFCCKGSRTKVRALRDTVSQRFRGNIKKESDVRRRADPDMTSTVPKEGFSHAKTTSFTCMLLKSSK